MHGHGDCTWPDLTTEPPLGFNLTCLFELPSQIGSFVMKILASRGYEGRPKWVQAGRPSDGWFRLFEARHPELSVRRGDPLGHSRREVSKQQLDSLHDALEEVERLNGGPLEAARCRTTTDLSVAAAADRRAQTAALMLTSTAGRRGTRTGRSTSRLLRPRPGLSDRGRGGGCGAARDEAHGDSQPAWERDRSQAMEWTGNCTDTITILPSIHYNSNTLFFRL